MVGPRRDVARPFAGTAAAWMAIAITLMTLQWISSMSLVQRPSSWRWPGAERFLGGWVQFDGPEYIRIAVDGYWFEPGARAPVTWFPLYAIGIRVGQHVVGSPTVAAVTISAAAGLAGVLLFRQWIRDHGISTSQAPWTVALFLLYPYGWFRYGAAYPDGLFLALALGAFLFQERDRPGAAALLASLATATRPTAVALIPALLVLGMTRSGFLSPVTTGGRLPRFAIDRSRWNLRLLWPTVGLSGLIGYSMYLHIRFDAALAWATTQAEWSGSGPTTWLKAGFVARMLDWSDPVYSSTVLAQMLVLVLVVVTAPAVGRRFGWGYAVFVICLVVIPCVSSRDFLGVGRYLMAAFPTIALLGERLAERRGARVPVLLACGTALLLLNAAFARSTVLA
jgi:hypothetical protein